jgi:ectoine hydroxylase-related dioxygenase (phytanoyl-CoA dioxygenase family)
MRFIPRSHLRRDLDLGCPGEVLGTAMNDEVLETAGLSAADAVDVVLEPGDLALWNPYLVHGSGLNQAEHRRRLYINGYVRAQDCDRGEWAFRGAGPLRGAARAPRPALRLTGSKAPRPAPPRPGSAGG